MKFRQLFAALAIAAPLVLASCAGKQTKAEPMMAAPSLTSEQKSAIEAKGLDVAEYQALMTKPIYTMSEDEVDTYLRGLRIWKPELSDRVVQLGKQNLGQPYEIFLLGEAPFETYDPQPLYCLEKSDCVVFSEHTYAMALAHDWPSFFKMLQRIRYKDGEISVITRNHYTEVDWDKNNSWLIEDVTDELVGDDAVAYEMPVDRSKFFRNRYKLDVDFPKIVHKEEFIPLDQMPEVEKKLTDGAFVNVVRERNGGYWVGHTGLVSIGEDGTAYFLHSTPPKVRIQPFQEYIAQHKAREARNPNAAHLAGFKFLRLREDPIANLKEIDGPDAPVITPPTRTGIPRIEETAKAD